MKKNDITIIIAFVFIIGFGYLLTANNNMMNEWSFMGGEHHEDDRVKSHEIYPGDVAEKIKNNENIILLDVRTPEEYEEIHIKGALLLPVQEMSQQSLSSIGLGEDSKNKEIILYCHSGARSKTAYDIMTSLGYTNIKSSAGGMVHWEEDNYPFTETGAYTKTPTTIKEGGTKVLENGPRITLDQTFHDFGLIPQYGGVVEKTFIVENKGTKTLAIGDLTTSCSCTSAKISNKEIEVGGQATLTVIFDPDFHGEPVGVFKRTVFIPTNDPTNPEAEVVVQVDINEGK